MLDKIEPKEKMNKTAEVSAPLFLCSIEENNEKTMSLKMFKVV